MLLLTVRDHTEADVIIILVADPVKRCLHSICQELRHLGLLVDAYPNSASCGCVCVHVQGNSACTLATGVVKLSRKWYKNTPITFSFRDKLLFHNKLAII